MTPALLAVRRATALVLFGLLPACAVLLVFGNARGEGIVTDFENIFYPAANAVLNGSNPYPDIDDPGVAAGVEYLYPPLTALATTPFTALPSAAAGIVVMVLLVAGVLGTLWVLEVRDWRCYGLALLWPPVIAAIQTGNVTIPLAFGAALVWRYRDHAWIASGSLGLTLATKFFLWPLTLWLGFTERIRAAALAIGVGAVVLLVSWAVIGFAGLEPYPDLLRRFHELEDEEGYTIYALAVDLGFAQSTARALWIGLAVLLIAGIAVLGHRRDDRRAFAIAVSAALACSPIVWLHYFALLLVVVAVAERRLGPAWFVPLLMYASSGNRNGTTAQTALTIAAAALTVALAVRPARLTRLTSRDNGIGAAVEERPAV